MAFYSPEQPSAAPDSPTGFTPELIQEVCDTGIELRYFNDGLHEFTFSDIGGSVKVYINREKAQVYVWYASPTLNPEIFTFDETGLFAEVLFAFTILSDRGTPISYSEFVNALTPII